MDRRRGILNAQHEGSDYSSNYLTIEALQDGLTAKLSVNACEYCVDGDGNWKTLSAGTTTESINTGHTLSFRGNLTPTSSKGIGTFTVNKNFNLKGNVMSMLFGDAGKNNYSLSGKDYAFCKLFYACSTLKTVSSNFLSATILSPWCYSSMFDGCSSLTIAPELPATTLAKYCYNYMFYDCTSLIAAPNLPATTLLPACYKYMFFNCTALAFSPVISATTVATDCCWYMFYNCTSLTTAPVLRATILAEYCYACMFYGCSRLNYIEMLATNISATNCLTNWVVGVAATGTFVKNVNATWNVIGNNGVPTG